MFKWNPNKILSSCNFHVGKIIYGEQKYNFNNKVFIRWIVEQEKKNYVARKELISSKNHIYENKVWCFLMSKSCKYAGKNVFNDWRQKSIILKYDMMTLWSQKFVRCQGNRLQLMDGWKIKTDGWMDGCSALFWFSLWGNGWGGVAVGVVDQSVEGLVDPLPEHHSRNGPETRAAGSASASQQEGKIRGGGSGPVPATCRTAAWSLWWPCLRGPGRTCGRWGSCGPPCLGGRPNRTTSLHSTAAPLKYLGEWILPCAEPQNDTTQV